MRIDFTKHPRDTAMRILLASGIEQTGRFPNKGPFPHDLMHYSVERAFAFRNAFWGLIANGKTPDEIARFAAAHGHASAAKAHTPSPEIIELLQAERLVECFEAELWGQADLDDLQSVADAAFSASFVPRVLLDETRVVPLRAEITALNARWQALGDSETLTVTWP